MVVWRDHDHMHQMTPDYTVVGLLRSAGFEAGKNPTMRPGILTIPETTFGEFAAGVKRSSGARALRCVGDPKAKVSKILVGPGYATAVFAVPSADTVAIVLAADERYPAKRTTLELLTAAVRHRR